MPSRFVQRVAPTSVTPDGVLRAGAAEVDITPPFGFPMAGYSSLGKTSSGTAGRLWARSLVIQDGAGIRVALCFVDLMSASRYLFEKAASTTAASCGIGPAQLILAGTHTHTGPGWFYGNSLYDHFATPTPGFDAALADFLARRIATSIEEATGVLRPARLGIGVQRVWGVSRNRSFAAFLRNAEASKWNRAGFPGAGGPATLTQEQRSIDPRLTVIAAFEATSGVPIGVFGTFGCHSNSIGAGATFYSADWPGAACRVARSELESASPGTRVVVAVALSAAGDVNALRYGLTPKFDPGPGLAAFVGDQVGRGLVAGAREAEMEASASTTLQIRYSERAVDDTVGLETAPPLASRWFLGAPTLGGSEESRSVLHTLGLTHEGMAGDEFPPSDPQHPKLRGLGIVQDILKGLLDLDPCLVLPLHALRIGSHLIATVPGEPTTIAAYRIEQALLRSTGAATVSVLGYAGDYGGYYAAPEEYAAQHYEGASTLYGRNAVPHVAARLERLAAGLEPAPIVSGSIEFDTGPERKKYRAGDDCRAGVDPQPQVQRSLSRVELRWEMPRGCRVGFEGRWLVKLEKVENNAWVPVLHQGREFDDVNQPIVIRRVGAGDPLRDLAEALDPGPDRELWIASFDIPPTSAGAAGFLVSVAPRDRFTGFQVQFSN